MWERLFKTRVKVIVVGKTKSYQRIGFKDLPTLKRCQVRVTPLVVTYTRGYSVFAKQVVCEHHSVYLEFFDTEGKKYTLKWISKSGDEESAVNRAFALALMAIKIKKYKLPQERWVEVLNPHPTHWRQRQH